MNCNWKIWRKPEIIHWTQNLLDSYERLLGKPLIPRPGNLEEQARTLFLVPFAVTSHGIEADPIFNYGNQTMLDLWEISWEELKQMPSRKTVRDYFSQEERDKMLLQAREKGYIAHYHGIRITKSGKLFKIENVLVWNISSFQGEYLGQAATFSQWKFI